MLILTRLSLQPVLSATSVISPTVSHKGCQNRHLSCGFMCNCCMRHATIIAPEATSKIIVQLVHKNCMQPRLCTWNYGITKTGKLHQMERFGSWRGKPTKSWQKMCYYSRMSLKCCKNIDLIQKMPLTQEQSTAIAKRLWNKVLS